MNRRVPVFATLLVAAAVVLMISLRFWQLGRQAEKTALLATYADATNRAAPVPFPETPEAIKRHLYRRSRLTCEEVLSQRVVAGRTASGESGYAVQARCRTDSGINADLVLGIAPNMEPVKWRGGRVDGIIAPGANGEARLFADPPVAGLQATARPNPGDLPNNHLSYAVQWFLFARTAVIIYVLALRRSWRRDSA